MVTPLKKPVKNGPRTVETQRLWDAGMARLGIDAPRLRNITEDFERERAETAERAKAYYLGGYKMSVSGAPMRCAAVVAKMRNKERIYTPMTSREFRRISNQLVKRT